jgi:hypothetical protein
MANLPTHPRETPKAAEAFSVYAHLGPARSLAKTAAAMGKNTASIRQLELWSARYDWVLRSREWDISSRNEAEDAARRRQEARAERRAAERERMEDERVVEMHRLWREALVEIHRHLDNRDYRGGLVGLVAVMGRALDEERKALGADVVRWNVTSASAPIAPIIAYDPAASEQIRKTLSRVAAGIDDWRRAHPGIDDDLR